MKNKIQMPEVPFSLFLHIFKFTLLSILFLSICMLTRNCFEVGYYVAFDNITGQIDPL